MTGGSAEIAGDAETNQVVCGVVLDHTFAASVSAVGQAFGHVTCVLSEELLDVRAQEGHVR